MVKMETSIKQTKRYAGEDRGRKMPIKPEDGKYYWVRFTDLDPEPALFSDGMFLIIGSENPQHVEALTIIGEVEPPPKE